MSVQDTICALASGPPPSAIAIVRVSGAQVTNLCVSLLSCGIPEPRRAVLCEIRDSDGDTIDQGLALYMPGPASYTGEDTLELYLHGGAAVIGHALASLAEFDGVRLAEPGEFTRRAFEAGKLDLAEAEGVADIIEAETAAQKAQALRQLSGGLSRIYDAWRDRLTGVLALIEVSVDFPDEGDAPDETNDAVVRGLDALISEIEDALGDKGIGERIRDGFRVAIVGAPNAGKSSLLNQLAGRDAAIVTPTAGTTRDVIEIRRVLGGQVVWFSDTAGLRATDDEIEAEGVRRAMKAAEEADLRIYLFDSQGEAPDCEALPFRTVTDMIVVNKSDLASPSWDGVDMAISARTGDGVADLEGRISAFIGARAASVEAPVITRSRHRAKLEAGLDCLLAARRTLASGAGAELAAEDVRLALRHLGAIIGVIGVEDILGAVFSKFCIGK